MPERTGSRPVVATMRSGSPAVDPDGPVEPMGRLPAPAIATARTPARTRRWAVSRAHPRRAARSTRPATTGERYFRRAWHSPPHVHRRHTRLRRLPGVPLSADQKAMLQLLLERGQSYDDLASILGAGPTEVRSRARAALTELAGTDPDRNVALTDYLLGQADPIDRADAVRHLKDDPEDFALVTELAQKLRLVAPEAELPGRPGEDRQPRARASTRRRLPKPLKKLAPAPKKSADGEPGLPRTTLSRRQTQGIVIAACATVLVAVGVLAIAGVFSSGSSGSTTTSSSTDANATPPSGTVQGYPLL